ncbi:DUF6367 family protein [Ekhidna sp.]
MKSLKKLLEEEVQNFYMESFEEFTNPPHIMVLGDFMHLNQRVDEGKWDDSGYKGYKIRFDKAHSSKGLDHVHIARDKHINAKNKQVAWNKDGSKHDKKSFNSNFHGMNKAKEIASKALGIKKSKLKESASQDSTANLILESSLIDYIPSKASIFVFELDAADTVMLFS